MIPEYTLDCGIDEDDEDDDDEEEEEEDDDDDDEDEEDDEDGRRTRGSSVVLRVASRPVLGNARIFKVVSSRILLKQQGQESRKPFDLLRKVFRQHKQKEQLAPESVQTENCKRAFSLFDNGARGA